MSTVIEGAYREVGNPDRLLPVSVTDEGNLVVAPASNIKTKFREAFEDYSPNTLDSNWVETKLLVTSLLPMVTLLLQAT